MAAPGGLPREPVPPRPAAPRFRPRPRRGRPILPDEGVGEDSSSSDEVRRRGGGGGDGGGGGGGGSAHELSAGEGLAGDDSSGSSLGGGRRRSSAAAYAATAGRRRHNGSAPPAGRGYAGGGGGAPAPFSTPPRRRPSADPPAPATLFSLVAPTRSGWAAAQRRWTADPVARTADLTDVGRGYRVLDPLSSATTTGWVTAVLLAAAARAAYGARASLVALAQSLRSELAATALCAAALAVVLLHAALRRPARVYLYEFTTFKPPPALQVSHDRFAAITTAINTFSAEDIDFQTRLLGRSGIGETSALPEGIHRVAELGEAAAAAAASLPRERGRPRGARGTPARTGSGGGGGAGGACAGAGLGSGLSLGALDGCGDRRPSHDGGGRRGGPPSTPGGSDTGSSGGGPGGGTSGSGGEAGRGSLSSGGSTGSTAAPVVPSRELSLHLARQEAEQVIFGVVDELLVRTGLDPRLAIDIVIVNCSLFSPSPSLSSMIVNHYRLRSSVRTYNLGGMGCSAGVIAVELARDLLQVHRGARALVVSTENLTQNWYLGAERSMLVGNALFRMGGSAVLMTNVPADVPRCRYRLAHVVRTHVGADDQAYDAIFEMEDVTGARGVKLSKNIMDVAGGALKRNLTELAPLVLPLREQARFFAHLGLHLWQQQRGWASAWRGGARGASGTSDPHRRRGGGASRSTPSRPPRPLLPAGTPSASASGPSSTAAALGAAAASPPGPYVPDFHTAFEHFCFHTGGRPVIDVLEKALDLTPVDVEASRYALRVYGNTSSASVWYEMEFLEAAGRMRSGDRTWQLAFGSGFKCNSAVWVALRDVPPAPDVIREG